MNLRFKWLIGPLIFWLSMKRFYHERYSYQASALAFLTMISLVPLTSVMVYIISFFPIFSDFMKLTQDYIYNNFIPNTHSSQVMHQYFEQFILQVSQLPKLGILFSVLTGFILVFTIEGALNDIWKVRYKTKSAITVFFAWIILLFMPIFIGITTFLSGYISTWLYEWQYLFLYALHIIINTILLSTLYVVIPNTIVKWRDGLIGGLTAVLLFEIIRKCFVFYISHFATYEAIYGAVAIIPIFLIWLYIAWIIILFGAVIAEMTEEVLEISASE